MNPDDLVTQIGLIFSQMRYIRIVVDQLERSVARYSGLAMEAFAGGPAFGAPPLLDGALKVHLVNIGDIAVQDNSFGGFLMGILRGVSSAFAGAVAGVFGAFLAPVNLALLAKILSDVKDIIERLGLGGKSDEKKSGNTIETLREITSALKLAREVLFGMSQDPNQQDEQQRRPLSEFLNTVGDTLKTVNEIVKGITQMLPMAIGFLASLLLKLDQLRGILLGLIEFAIRNLLLLRGAIVVVLFDTLAVAARLVSELLSILGKALTAILTSIFNMINAAVDAIMAAFKAVSLALKGIVDEVLPWLVNNILRILTAIGNLTIFQKLDNMIYNLAVFASAIGSLAGKSVATPTAPTPLTSTAPTIDPKLLKLPDFTKAPGVESSLAIATTALENTAKTLNTETRNVFGTAQTAASKLAAASKDALTSATTGFNATIDDKLKDVQGRAKGFTDALVTAQQASTVDKSTGLAKIAEAYEKWLSDGGVDQIMEKITSRFATAESTGGNIRRLIDVILAGAAEGPPRPTVEIPEITVEIIQKEPAGAKKRGQGKSGPIDVEFAISDEEAWERGMVAVTV